ncbi:MFS transporter [Tenuifilum thalassicum]|uniref:Lysosomal dipeptide transporter MFSD1 n=1 Tax=Tenuifilum thalassicum TaxID=2590900 RepID=A0A7D4BZ19_9BACT|nr:MFS transporter [Tenuifilum thalassicum]QKG79424.1 major facilitator superfamily domain-containing protein 1 [Tenuifilum thalassicum]
MEKIRQTLRDHAWARWTALGIVAFTMLTGYYLTDVMAPLKGLLEQQLSWDSSEYGFFTSAYGWFNVFLFMLIIGGIILDKMGVRFTGLSAAVIMVLGTAIKYWAVSTHSLDGQTWNILWLFPMKAQVFMAALGYAIFGVGVEVAGITVSKIIVKWFKGKELALAMGLEMATARMGTALALATSVPLAKSLGHVSKPILVCLILLVIGLIAFFIYTFMDKKLDASQAEFDKQNNVVNEEEEFKVSDIFKIVTNKGWWYIAILCVLFYSAVFPFLKYAADLMVNKFGVQESLAGTIPAMLPFGTILLTPLFGNIYDRKGKGATIMLIGSLLLIFVHGMFSIPFLNHWIIAIILIVILGIGFSLVPSAMWPSVPKIIPENQLGTAYSLIFWVQNWGLMGVPALIGWVLDKYCVTGQKVVEGVTVNTYNYTLPMLIFTSLGVLALIFAFLLKAEDKKKGYGLELPNIEK